MKARLQCIDMNTQYCPCILAETQQCILCSHLQGKDFCECDWNGLCILNLKEWQLPLKITEDTIFRQEEEVRLNSKEQVGKNTYLLAFTVSDDLAAALKKVGSFVFLRLPGDSIHFQFPVGVFKVNDCEIKVVIESVGPKTVRFFQGLSEKVVVHGPYFNGVFGQPWIDKMSYGTILLIAGGIGQAPALPLAEKLIAQHNQVKALIAPGQVGNTFIQQELETLGAVVQVTQSLRTEGFHRLKEWFMTEKQLPDLVVSAGPDAQHRAVIKTLDAAHINLPLVATNNAVMCCGEGICGSCLKTTRNRQQIRTCKVQTDFAFLVDESKEE